MKKILTVSLMAMMVVGAARADIASVGYVEDKLASKANVSDVTSISNKLGTIADGKTVVDLIEAAKQDAIAGVAAYDDTEVRGLIGDNAEAISELESKVGNSSVADQIDAVRATTIAGLTEEQQQTMFPTVDLTGQMIATSTNDFATSIGDNATAIQDINNSAVMKSGITEGKVAAYDAYAGAISDNADAIAAINNAENGLLKQAETAAKAYTDTEVKKVDDKLADYALNSTIGEVESGKTVVQMISDAKTAATYNDTEVRGLIGANKTATETNAAAIKEINEGAVMTSGITKDKVDAYDAYAGAISDNADAIAAINNSENGLLKQAETAANAYTDTEVKKVDDKLANYALNSTIGTVDEGKTVVQMISDAKTAATYDDTAVKGLIDANKTATETNAASIAAMAQAGIKAEGAGDGTYALTMKVTDGVRTFQWDQIGY